MTEIFPDSKSPIAYNLRKPMIIVRDEVNFYVMIFPIPGEQRYLFYACVTEGEDVRKKYMVKVFLKDPKSGQMELLTVSGVVPVDLIFKEGKVRESGLCGSVAENILLKHKENENGVAIFRVKIEIQPRQLSLPYLLSNITF